MFICPSCGNNVVDNGTYSCGYCGNCGIFFHAMQRLLPGYDLANDPYGYVPSSDGTPWIPAFEPRAEAEDAIPSSETREETQGS